MAAASSSKVPSEVLRAAKSVAKFTKSLRSRSGKLGSGNCTEDRKLLLDLGNDLASPSLNASIHEHIETISDWDEAAGSRASDKVTEAVILTRRRTLRLMWSRKAEGESSTSDTSTESGAPEDKEPPVEAKTKATRTRRRWRGSVEAAMVEMATLDSENGPEGSTIESFDLDGIHDL